MSLAAEAEGGLTPAVVGEGMSARVIPYAQKNGLTYYEGLANPENYSQEELLAHNQAQIQAWKADGRSVIDIGPDPLRPGYPGPTSPNYAMELQELHGTAVTHASGSMSPSGT